MCCKFKVIFRPILETHCHREHPTLYFICQFTFFPHTLTCLFHLSNYTLKSLSPGPIYLFIPSCAQYCGKQDTGCSVII